MSKCEDHYFHVGCLVDCKGAAQFIKCPICGISYGVITGEQPKGQMRVKKVKRGASPCAGFENVGTIIISYNFPNGTIGDTHYTGTRRIAYLPDNREGNEVLRLL
jgi:deltex-like protein